MRAGSPSRCSFLIAMEIKLLGTRILHFPHCTLALTDALPLMVNVHVLVLLPPLAHAPDQIASRPLLTLKVIALLAAKLAD